MRIKVIKVLRDLLVIKAKEAIANLAPELVEVLNELIDKNLVTLQVHYIDSKRLPDSYLLMVEFNPHVKNAEKKAQDILSKMYKQEDNTSHLRMFS